MFDDGDGGLEQEDQRCSRGRAPAVACGSGVTPANALAGFAFSVAAGTAAVFWRLIATGMSSAEAALGMGVSVPVGMRWFRHAGGMPPLSLVEPCRRYLSFEEREEIALLRAQKLGVRKIARRIGRDPGTISRELRRNAATRGGKPQDRALVAQWKAQQAAKRPKVARGWRPTIGSATMSTSDFLATSTDPTAASSSNQSRRRGRGSISRTGRTDGGHWRGVRSRSRTG